jgi:hypothetical protein
LIGEYENKLQTKKKGKTMLTGVGCGVGAGVGWAVGEGVGACRVKHVRR